MKNIKIGKAKIWKIGTKIESYLDDFFYWMKLYDKKVGDIFHVTFSKNNNNVFFHIGEIENVDKAKGTQMLRILIGLNILIPIGIEYFDETNDLIDNVNYKINSNEKNWRENFIEVLKNYQYIESKNEDEYDEIKYYFKQQKNLIFSILKSFESIYEEEINEYKDEDKKVLNFWNLKSFFTDFDNELSNIYNVILYKNETRVKKIKNLDNVEWSDFSIRNLDEIKNGEIDSSLWNLSDIINYKYKISIPIMQRKYVWDFEILERLIDDVFSIGNDKKFHYIGSIVYKENNEKKEIKILDGQQRLTTMFLILTALYCCFIWASDEEGIKVPKFFKKIFSDDISKNNSLLKEKFVHVYGNSDYDEFKHILKYKQPLKKIEKGNMSNNFDFSYGKIIKYIKSLPISLWQETLETIFKNLVERVAFTINKNQIESEYEIFEKLNTLSKPLTQIDLLKNHLLPYCKSEALDENEKVIQKEFDQNIFLKFEKNKKVSEASVKRFVNYFVQLYEQKFILDENKNIKIFDKLSKILEKKFNLEINSLNFNDFIDLLKNIGDEIDSFQSITDKEKYTNKDNKYYPFSDILFSFDQRYVYAPLIKKIFDLFVVENFNDNNKRNLFEINKVRKILFEIERYEMFLQVVLYRGQSISKIIEKINKKVEILFKNNELNEINMRKIFNNNSIMSSALVIPELESFSKKISEESIADKVSVSLLNRIKFYFNNNENIEIQTSFENRYLKKSSREHIISQKISSEDEKKEILISDGIENYSSSEFNKLHKINIDMIGNILIVESSDNSKFQNKSPRKKIDDYIKLPYLKNDPVFTGIKNEKLSLINNLKKNDFIMGFNHIILRSKEISKYLRKIYN